MANNHINRSLHYSRHYRKEIDDDLSAA